MQFEYTSVWHLHIRAALWIIDGCGASMEQMSVAPLHAWMHTYGTEKTCFGQDRKLCTKHVAMYVQKRSHAHTAMHTNEREHAHTSTAHIARKARGLNDTAAHRCVVDVDIAPIKRGYIATTRIQDISGMHLRYSLLMLGEILST